MTDLYSQKPAKPMKAPLLILLILSVTGLSFAGDLSLHAVTEEQAKAGAVPWVWAGTNLGKPGYYEYQKGLTLIELLAKIGGITADAHGDSIWIMRKEKLVAAKLEKILDGSSTDLQLEPGDRVQAPFQGCFGGGLSDEALAAMNKRIEEYASRLEQSGSENSK